MRLSAARQVSKVSLSPGRVSLVRMVSNATHIDFVGNKGLGLSTIKEDDTTKDGEFSPLPQLHLRSHPGIACNSGIVYVGRAWVAPPLGFRIQNDSVLLGRFPDGYPIISV